MKFSELELEESVLEALDAMRFDECTPIQEQAIPIILEGKDLIAVAQTGTGKTAAFLLPIINQLLVKDSHAGSINAMVIVPTRELAIQISQHLEGLSYFTNVSSIAVYGGGDGNNFVQEKKAVSSGADIVVCTPGKMMAHIKMGYVKLQHLQYLVLDEADRMLDMGFYDDIMFIIKHLPQKRQNLLFSATMPFNIKKLAQTILHQPEEVSISISKPPDKIVQKAFMVYDAQKIAAVLHIIREANYKYVLIFCSSKLSVKQLTRELKRNKIVAGEIHSDLEQQQREEVLGSFRSGRLPVLVATDILSRGIDIDSIELVINFDVPHDGEDYVHRVGRTARAESDGTAITLINPKEQRKFAAIEKLLGKSIDKLALPEALGEQPEYNPVLKPKPGPKKRFNKGRRQV